MKLSDVVSGAGLSSFAEIALLIFLGVFIAVALRAFLSPRAAMDHAARMPLEDEPSSSRAGSPSGRDGAE